LEADDLIDAQWERIEPFVPGGRKGRRGPRSNNRRFVNALIWMARSGARWRDMPDRFGDFQTAKRRYYRWIEMGVLDELFCALAREADLEWVAIDSTSIRAQAQAAGAARKRGGLRPRVLAARGAASGPRSMLASTPLASPSALS
jgi:transposase